MKTNKLTKKTAKLVAMDALSEGRVSLALFIMTSVMGRDEAMMAMASKPEPKLGDVLVCSWGYDQTNVDFYEVVAVTKSSVRICQIKTRYVSSDQVMPAVGAFIGEEMLKRVSPGYSGGYQASISSYSTAQLWDGGSRYETPSEMGH